MPRWEVHFQGGVDLNDPQIVRLLAEADAISRAILDIPLPPRTRRRFDRLNILRAVRGTTAIEGSDLSEQEVEQVLEAKSVRNGTHRRQEVEVRNAAVAMQHIVNTVNRDPDRPLRVEDTVALHTIITHEIDYPLSDPGHYRQGDRSAGTFMAPPAEDAPRLMEDFHQWFRSPEVSRWHPCVRAIVAHFYLVTIHPFGDGNGRTARAVESMLLYRAGINVLGFYSLANYYYRNRDDYIEHLDRARFEHDGTLTEMVQFGLRGLVEELEYIRGEVRDAIRLIAFRDFARERLMSSGNLHAKTGNRRLALTLALLGRAIPLRELRRRTHPESSLYTNTTNKTITRDLTYLKDAELVTVREGMIEANLSVMDQFVPD